MADETCGATADALRRRDLGAVLDALHLGPERCFVWPQTYPKTYHYQRVAAMVAPSYGVDADLHALPVVMRSAKTSLYCKYGKHGWVARVIGRYIVRFRVTKVDDSAGAVVRDLTERLDRKHRLHDRYYFQIIEPYIGAVLVEGRLIPIDRDRLAVLERSMKIVEKIDRLAKSFA